MQLILPRWLRDEIDQVIASQIHLARGLQARLVDHERNLSPRTEVKTRAIDVVDIVKKLDQTAGELAHVASGSKVLQANETNMRHTMEFAAYCERSLKHAARKNG